MSYKHLILCSLALQAALPLGYAEAVELLTDTGFEDPIEVDAPDSAWDWPNGNDPMPTVNATSDPLSGLEHAELVLDTNQLFDGFGPNIRSTVFAGVGAAESVSDFTGMTITVSTNFKVTALNMTSPDPEAAPAVLVRTYVDYFSDVFGFLEFGGLIDDGFVGDQFPEAVDASYQDHSYSLVVPNFGTPVTSIGFITELVAPTTDVGLMTGTATVLVDDVSLDLATASPGDFDESGFVDGLDLPLWAAGFGTTGVATVGDGDADADGDADIADVMVWQRNFAPAPPPITAIPEPTAIASLVAWLTIALCRRSACDRASSQARRG